MILHLLNLESAMKLHEQLVRNADLFPATGCIILQLLKSAMEIFMRVQTLLEVDNPQNSYCGLFVGH